jgi:hypothetical protein
MADGGLVERTCAALQSAQQTIERCEGKVTLCVRIYLSSVAVCMLGSTSTECCTVSTCHIGYTACGKHNVAAVIAETGEGCSTWCCNAAG